MDGDDIPAAGNRVQVVVRVRPLMPAEIREEVAVTCSDDGSQVQIQAPLAGARAYTFDSCMKGPTTQEELFDACGFSELVEAALDGYSVTVFAFGQTGSGKTHTMIGPRLSRSPGSAPLEPSQPSSATIEEEDEYPEGFEEGKPSTRGYPEEEDGVLPRCIRAAFASISERKEEADFTVSTSCVELYQDTATDLLAKGKAGQSQNLPVRQNPKEGFRVEGLSWSPCPSSASALEHMRRALSVRHTRSHKLNAYSSRSHCLITFRFESQEKAMDAQGAKGGVRRYGKLTLVDLAGSERLKETGNTSKDAVRETGSINKSLFTLGQVLASLSAHSHTSAPVFIPYRDSKLTSLLWEGLKGTGRALMLACLGPTLRFVEESLNTLHFASMALRIKARPVIILDPQDKLVVELRDTIRQLRDENRQLAVSLMQISSGEADISSIMDALPPRLLATGTPSGITPPSSAPGVLKVRSSTAGLFSSPTSPSKGAGRPLAYNRSSDVSSSFSPPSPSRSNNASQGKSRGNTGGGYPPRARSSGFGPPSSPIMWKRPTGSPSIVASFLRQPSPGGGGSGWPQSRGGQHGPYRSGNALPQLQVMLPSSSSQGDVVGGGGGGDFPELAAMEAEFQMLMPSGADIPGGLGGGDDRYQVSTSSPSAASGSMASSPSSWSSRRNQNQAASRSRPSDKRLPSPLNPHLASQLQQPPHGTIAPPPDSKALKWADVNTWFGTDTIMTDLAYKIHDELVGGDQMDPESDGYYRELEKRVSEACPDRWATWLGLQESRKAEGGGAMGKKANRPGYVGRSQKAHPGTPSPTKAAYQTMQDAFNRASKGKNPSSGSFLPSVPVASNPSSPDQQASQPPRESSPSSIRHPNLVTPPFKEPQHPSKEPQHLSRGLPGGIGRLEGSPSPSPSSRQAGSGSKPPVQQVAPVFQLLDYGEIQKEYLKQRQLVVDELRNAKKEMEMERERIREKIDKMLGRKGGNFRF